MNATQPSHAVSAFARLSGQNPTTKRQPKRRVGLGLQPKNPWILFNLRISGIYLRVVIQHALTNWEKVMLLHIKLKTSYSPKWTKKWSLSIKHLPTPVLPSLKRLPGGTSSCRRNMWRHEGYNFYILQASVESVLSEFGFYLFESRSVQSQRWARSWRWAIQITIICPLIWYSAVHSPPFAWELHSLRNHCYARHCVLVGLFNSSYILVGHTSWNWSIIFTLPFASGRLQGWRKCKLERSKVKADQISDIFQGCPGLIQRAIERVAACEWPPAVCVHHLATLFLNSATLHRHSSNVRPNTSNDILRQYLSKIRT